MIFSSSMLFFESRIRYVKTFNNPVLIWNMGKVASTSIAHSLQNNLGKASVFTSHFMNDKGHPRSVSLFKGFIENNKFPLPLITLTREPVGRNISSFFQNFEKNTGHSYEEGKFSQDDLKELFLNKFDKHEVTLNWYDNNLQKFLGFDVFRNEFDRSRGYEIFKHNGYRILVLRSEEDDKTKENAVKKLLMLDEFNLANTNVGNEKVYSSDYLKFRKNLKLPTEYLDRMLSSKYTGHFYNDSFVEKIREKYS